MKVPYFLSAQLDGSGGKKGDGNSEQLEGWIGLIVFNVFVWVTIVALDIYLLAFQFNDPETQMHVLQMAALISVSVPASTIVVFTIFHYLNGEPFSSTEYSEARMLPPFATALIAGGLKATLGFSYVILLLSAPNPSHDSEVLKILVVQVCIKHFGSAMALANARLKVYTSMQVVSAAS